MIGMNVIEVSKSDAENSRSKGLLILFKSVSKSLVANDEEKEKYIRDYFLSQNIIIMLPLRDYFLSQNIIMHSFLFML